MNKRKPPYALVSILLVLIGVAVVMGGRMMNMTKDTNSEEMEAAIAKKAEEEQQTHKQLTPVKPGDLRDAAKERSKPHLPDADIPKPELPGAIPKQRDMPPPKPSETGNRSLRGY